METFGKTLIILGIILLGTGFAFIIMGKLPFLGRLPGDIFIQKKNFSFYFPITTCLLISIILSILFWWWAKR